MGLAISLEAGRTPLLARGRNLLWLALFGFIHGFHEWFELYLMVDGQLASLYPLLLDWIRLFLLVISFSFLVIFGWQALSTVEGPSRRRLVGFAWFLLGCLIVVYVDSGVFPQSSEVKIPRLDAYIRYLLGVTGAALAGLAFWDLDAFYARLRQVTPNPETIPLEKAHHRRLLLALSVGGLLTLVISFFQMRLSLGWAIVIGLAVVLLIREGIRSLNLDYKAIVDSAKFVFDTRNATRKVAKDSEKVVRL